MIIMKDQVEDPKIIVSFHLMGQLHPITPALANPLVNSLDVHFDLSKTLLRSDSFKDHDHDDQMIPLLLQSPDILTRFIAK